MALADFVNILDRYRSASATTPPETAQQDFNQVAPHAPASSIASGLAEAFRSNQTPPFSQMLGTLFGQSNNQQKAGILNQLAATAGPSLLSSGVLGSLGSLSGLLGGGQQITPDQAAQVPAETVEQLAEHAQKHDPSIIDQASSFYAQHPTLVQALGAGSLALIMSHISR